MPSTAGTAELRRENAHLADRLGTATAHLGTVTAHLDTVTTAYETLKADYASLKDQLDWFKRQLFGRHSEKRLEYDLTEQASLFEQLGVEDAPASEVPTEEISYRRRRKSPGAAVNDSGLRFDESVPVTTIEVKDAVAAAQTAHVLESRVLAMDETPIKAGLKEPGKMRQGYFWPVSVGHASTGRTTRSCSRTRRRGSTVTWKPSSGSSAARW